MHVVYGTLLAFLFPFSYVLATKNALRPKFNPYCSTKFKCRTVCSCETHTNCSLLPMDETTRNSILYYHNQIRDIQSNGEPQPSSMTLLEYDSELEDISKCWAGRCTNEYSDCFLTPKFNETSQSVVQLILEGGETPSTFLWMQMMSYWLKQASSISVEAFNSLPTGKEYEFVHNFAQLMSDKIFHIGCAWSITDNLLTFVCTYGPRGPNSREKIYKMGKYCSSCPENYQCDFKKPFKRLCKKKKIAVTTSSSSSTTLLSSTHSRSQRTTKHIPIFSFNKKFNSESLFRNSERAGVLSRVPSSSSTTTTTTQFPAQTFSQPKISSTGQTNYREGEVISPITKYSQPSSPTTLPPSWQTSYQAPPQLPEGSLQFIPRNVENTYVTIAYTESFGTSTSPFWNTQQPQEPMKTSTFSYWYTEQPYTDPTKPATFSYWDSQEPYTNPTKAPTFSYWNTHQPYTVPTKSSTFSYWDTQQPRLELVPRLSYPLEPPPEPPKLPPVGPSIGPSSEHPEVFEPSSPPQTASLNVEPETPPILPEIPPTEPPIEVYPVFTREEISSSTEKGNSTPSIDTGNKKQGGDTKTYSEENATFPLVAYLCMGIVFVIIGLALFFLVMYTLRMSTICV